MPLSNSCVSLYAAVVFAEKNSSFQEQVKIHCHVEMHAVKPRNLIPIGRKGNPLKRTCLPGIFSLDEKYNFPLNF